MENQLHEGREEITTRKATLRLRAALALLIAAACSADAPPPPPEPTIQPISRIELDSIRTVEIIGLRRWTVQMIQDSLKKYAPGEGLESHACAANLRQKLHFADADIVNTDLVFDNDETMQIVISVREPQDSARVHYEPQKLDTVPKLAAYRWLTENLTDRKHVDRLHAVSSAHFDGPSRTVRDTMPDGSKLTRRIGYDFESASDSLDALPALDSIRARTKPIDLTTAISTIDSSSSFPDRLVAILILANFPDRDEAWHALLRAATGREAWLDAGMAGQALGGLSLRHPRAVNWTPMARTIHDVLDGTALDALRPLATVLTRTGASPRDASAYLAGGGEMLTAYLESINVGTKDPAHSLLVALRGSDLGPDPEPWRAWIATLPK